MTQSRLATLMLAGAAAGGLALAPTSVRAAEAGPTAPYRVDCWIGMKFGDQPGQLIRGWICERPYRPADADRQAATSAPEPRLADEEDVAEIGFDDDPR